MLKSANGETILNFDGSNDDGVLVWHSENQQSLIYRHPQGGRPTTLERYELNMKAAAQVFKRNTKVYTMVACRLWHSYKRDAQIIEEIIFIIAEYGALKHQPLQYADIVPFMCFKRG